MSPEQRQAARDRAADAIAPRDLVIIGNGGWPPPRLCEPGLCHAERKRRYRARSNTTAT